MSTVAPHPDATGTSRRARTWALVLLCTAQFMVVLDATIVNVALPAIQAELGFGSQAHLQYTISLYALTLGGSLILAGRMADVFGRRRMLMAGLLLFATASLLCGLAANPAILLGARALQGIGSAFMSTPALALITALFPEGPERNRALGAWGGVAGAAGAAGLIVGGVLTEFLGWAWVFFINVPLGVLTAVAALRLLPSDPAGSSRRRLDLPGAVSVTLGLGVLILGLTRIESAGVGDAATLGLLAAAVLLIGVFVLIERRAADPLVDLSLLRVPGVAMANVAGLVLTTVLASGCFFATLYVQEVLGFRPLLTGASFLPHSAAVVLGSALASRLAGRVGPGRTLALGFAALGAGSALLTSVAEDGTYAGNVLPGFTVFGFGIGVCMVMVTIVATRGVRDRDQAMASGVVNTSLQVGFAVGIAAVVSVAAARGEAVAGSETGRLVAGYSFGYLLDAVLAAAGLVLALLLLRRASSAVDSTAAPEQVTPDPR